MLEVSSSSDPEDGSGHAKEKLFPHVSDLPALPAKRELYWSQAYFALACVTGTSAALVMGTTIFCSYMPQSTGWPVHTLVPLIWLWASIALLGTTFVIFGRAGEVVRSPETCYPIPHEVLQRLLHNDGDMTSLSNIEGPVDSETCGTYCVRCLLWRPPRRNPVTGTICRSHHCGVCQRCFVRFDHHCDFFGRCIVNGNLMFFGATICMLWAGVFTAAAAFWLWVGCSSFEGGVFPS